MKKNKSIYNSLHVVAPAHAHTHTQKIFTGLRLESRFRRSLFRFVVVAAAKTRTIYRQFTLMLVQFNLLIENAHLLILFRIGFKHSHVLLMLVKLLFDHSHSLGGPFTESHRLGLGFRFELLGSGRF